MSRITHYMPINAEGTAFEEEVITIEVALLNLIPRIHNFSRAVILIDSKAAIQAIPPMVLSIIECRQMLQALTRQQNI